MNPKAFEKMDEARAADSCNNCRNYGICGIRRSISDIGEKDNLMGMMFFKLKIVSQLPEQCGYYERDFA